MISEVLMGSQDAAGGSEVVAERATPLPLPLPPVVALLLEMRPFFGVSISSKRTFLGIIESREELSASAVMVVVVVGGDLPFALLLLIKDVLELSLTGVPLVTGMITKRDSFARELVDGVLRLTEGEELLACRLILFSVSETERDASSLSPPSSPFFFFPLVVLSSITSIILPLLDLLEIGRLADRRR